VIVLAKLAPMHQLVIAALIIMWNKAVSASLVLHLVPLAQPHLSVVIPVLAITSSAAAVAHYAINPALCVLLLAIAKPVEPATI